MPILYHIFIHKYTHFSYISIQTCHEQKLVSCSKCQENMLESRHEKTLGKQLQPCRRNSKETCVFLLKKQPWLVVLNIFYFHPYLGKIPNLTNIFERGWNHQLVVCFCWKNNLSNVQNPLIMTFYYIDWFLGVHILFDYNPYVTG